MAGVTYDSTHQQPPPRSTFELEGDPIGTYALQQARDAHHEYVEANDGPAVLGDLAASARVIEMLMHAVAKRERDAGATWAQIAGPLGVTPQAAQQRFGRTSPAPVPPGATG